jgi:glucose/mannose transport system permease protein
VSTTTAVPPAPPLPLRARLRGRRVQRESVRLVKYAALAFFAVLVLMPVYVLLVTSVKDVAETDPTHAWSLPNVWTTAAWHDAWDQLSPNLRNSFELVIPATVISTVLGSLNGFVLSKWRFPGSDVIFTLFLFGMFIPYQAVMIPLTQLFDDANFPEGIPRLVFAHVVYGIPITALIFRSYYASIPEDLMEAARMDRAGMLRTYWSVVLPISAPAFVVTAI